MIKLAFGRKEKTSDKQDKVSGGQPEFVKRSDVEIPPVHDSLWRYWLRLYDATGNVPYRVAFDPVQVVEILPHIAMSDRVDENTQRVRLIGSAHDRMWGRNIVGMNLFDFVSPEMAASRKKVYQTLFSRGCGCLTEEVAESPKVGKVPYSALLLPLRNSKGTLSIIIGTYVFHAPPERVELLNAFGVQGRHLQKTTFIELG